MLIVLIMNGMFELGTGISFFRDPRDDSFVGKVMFRSVRVCTRVWLYTMTTMTTMTDRTDRTMTVLYDVTFVQVSE